MSRNINKFEVHKTESPDILKTYVENHQIPHNHMIA